MSTRSHIGIRNEDGSLDVIYCHWDGYPSYNGAVLFHHYQEPEKIRELIALGDGGFHQDQRGAVQAET